MPAVADSGTRQDHLFIVTDAFLEAYRAWSDGPENTLSPNDDFWRVTEELVALFADGDVPARLRTATATVEALGREWAEFIDRYDQIGDRRGREGGLAVATLPNQKFWKLADTLRQQRQEAEPKKRFQLEPIHGTNGLLAQKVPYKQICLIYGWMDNGVPEMWKLQEEIAEPGKHSTNAVSPLEIRQREKEARAAEIVNNLRERVARKVAIANDPPRESIEQLARQGVYIVQIAKMHKITPDKVLAELKGLGIEPPAWDRAADLAKATAPEYGEGEVGDARRRIDEATSRPLRHTPRPAAEEEYGSDEVPPGAEYLGDEEPADASGLDELMASNDDASQLGEELGGLTLEQEIIALHKDGFDDAKVAEQLGQKIGKVRHVLKAWAKDPAKFELDA